MRYSASNHAPKKPYRTNLLIGIKKWKLPSLQVKDMAFQTKLPTAVASKYQTLQNEENKNHYSYNMKKKTKQKQNIREG